MACMWVEPEQPRARKACGKSFASMHEINHPPHRGARGRARVHDARVLLAGLPAQRPPLQGQVQAGEPHPRAHGREALPVPVPRLWQGVRALREPQDPQANAHGVMPDRIP
ncbi:Zinc finger protein ZIC 1 [Gryllus bimaculatus]|nr:Zinc finger protein ZIC 1 [Gryllus bimaculatus]